MRGTEPPIIAASKSNVSDAQSGVLQVVVGGRVAVDHGANISLLCPVSGVSGEPTGGERSMKPHPRVILGIIHFRGCQICTGSTSIRITVNDGTVCSLSVRQEVPCSRKFQGMLLPPFCFVEGGGGRVQAMMSVFMMYGDVLFLGGCA